MIPAEKQDTQRDRKPVPDQATVRGDAAGLLAFAQALRGNLRPEVRGFVIPDSAEAYSEAIDNGAVTALHGAGFVICPPGTLAPALAAGEFGLNWPGADLSEVTDAIRAV